MYNDGSKLLNSNCIEYMDGIISVANKISHLFTLLFFQIDKEDFEKIVIAAQNIETIQFINCHMNFAESCDFKGKLRNATFHEIDFDNTGDSSYCNWKDDKGQTFKNIVEGLSKEEGVLNNLKTIRLRDCAISRNFAEKVLRDNRLDNVNLIDI